MEEKQSENDAITGVDIDASKPEKKTQAEIAAEFMANPDNQKNAMNMALQIQSLSKEKWFLAEDILKKTEETRLSLAQKLQMVRQFGHAQMRIGTWQDGKEKAGKPLYKIVITKEMKLVSLDEVIGYHKYQIEQLEFQKKVLMNN